MLDEGTRKIFFDWIEHQQLQHRSLRMRHLKEKMRELTDGRLPAPGKKGRQWMRYTMHAWGYSYKRA